jgi:hypothetical protein
MASSRFDLPDAFAPYRAATGTTDTSTAGTGKVSLSCCDWAAVSRML